jgi:mono/diheme cytochrome c family protein
MRPEVAGTIARGHLADDDHYDRGYVDGDWATSIPSRAMEGAGSWEALVRRGQSRFEVYCSPCHGSSGNGQGMVSQRALELMDQGLANWTPPTSLHDELAVNRTDGHLFNTITNGIRNMPAYGSQVPTQDRWAIVSYVRALQRSQAATLDDVPADARETLR